MAHKGHAVCEWTSKAACEKARKVATGQCAAMLDEDRQCGHWGIDKVDDRPYCGQHLNGVLLAGDEARRKAIKTEETNMKIDGYMAWRAEHPSVWDQPPR